MACAVAAGGAAGAVARWGITVGVQRLSASTLPWGTAAANALGCFAIGVASVWLVERGAHPVARTAVMTGLLGAMTTFSTFALETVHLLEGRRYGAALANVAGSAALGLAAVVAGLMIAKRL